MLPVRVIPCLLLHGDGLVKTFRFSEPRYVGDPINAVRIFNTKEVDELVFLDIAATTNGREPNFDLIGSIARESFMPLGYGGGITSSDQIRRLFSIGVEKVVLNTAAAANPRLITEAASISGSSSVVVSIDARLLGGGEYGVFTCSGTMDARTDPVTFARVAESAGAGEIFLTSIDRDGTQAGYDLDLIERVASAVSVPVVASGGAGSLSDFVQAVNRGASAVAAGSMFVFHGKLRAVLITYPAYATLEALFEEQGMGGAAGGSGSLGLVR